MKDALSAVEVLKNVWSETQAPTSSTTAAEKTNKLAIQLGKRTAQQIMTRESVFAFQKDIVDAFIGIFNADFDWQKAPEVANKLNCAKNIQAAFELYAEDDDLCFEDFCELALKYLACAQELSAVQDLFCLLRQCL